MNNKPLSVTQISTYLKNIINSETMLKNIAVVGEVSGFNVVRGIAYFAIKDENSLLNCVLFGQEKYGIFKNGDKVLVTGSPSYYVKGGRLTFNATKIEDYGLGELYKQFLELKKQLESEGLFAEVNKKALPKEVKRIGVVTSGTGAVIQDIINVVTRRSIGTDIVLYPVKVQGINAEYEIAEGINFFNSYNVDVIIVARGGGSIEDLQPFNTEVVARAVFKSSKPIISAVGHETDFTICDFVSDLRAPTPSAAAELVVVDNKEQIDKLNMLVNRMLLSQSNKLTNKTDIIKYLYKSLENNVNLLLTKNQNKLDLLTNSLSNLNPANLLLKGYAKLEMNSKPINTVKSLEIGQDLTAHMKDGKIVATIKSIKENV